MSSSSMKNKPTLTFQNLVCSQIELKRHAESFSHRRNTMCRRPSTQIPVVATINRRVTSIVMPYPSPSDIRISLPITPNMSMQLLDMKNFNDNSKNSQRSSANTTTPTIFEKIGERQSLVSMFYWDRSSRNIITKKVKIYWPSFFFYFIFLCIVFVYGFAN